MIGTETTASREKRGASALGALDNSIKELLDSIDQMEAALSPMLEHTPSDPNRADVKVPLAPGVSGMIREASDRVQEATRRMRALRDRLEF